MDDDFSKKMKISALVAFVLTAVILVVSGIEEVDAGETCAVTWFGERSGSKGPGLHYRIPIAEAYHCYSSRQLVYEAANNPEGSDADYTDVWVDTQTSDGQEIKVPYRIAFRVPESNVGFVYSEVATDMDGVVSRVVTTHSRPIVRQLARVYSASELYGGNTFELTDDPDDVAQIEQPEDKVPELESRVFEKLKPVFHENGVELLSVRVSKPEFEADYVNAIEEKQIAFERIQTERNNAAAAAQTARGKVETAKGDAEARRQEAQGEADAITTLAEADRQAIELRGEALSQYPEVLQLEFVQSLGESTVYLPSDTLDMFIPAPDPQ